MRVDIQQSKITQSEELEPGLVTAFRILMLLPLIAILPMPILLWISSQLEMNRLTAKLLLDPAPSTFPLSIIISSIYLSIPWFQRLLGRWFLPIGLALCTLGPLSILLTDLRTALNERVLDSISVIWAAPLFLLVPITIIAWQYRFQHLVVYCIVLAAIELGYGAFMGVPGEVGFQNLVQFVLSRTTIFLAVGYLVSSLVAAQRQQRSELARANQQLRQYASTLEELTVSRERNRMAHELHDTLAHTMSGMILQLQGVEMMWDHDSQRARQSLDASIGTVRKGLDETRRALKSLRASPLEEKGLVEALRHLATEVATRSKLSLDLQLPDHTVQLSPTLEQTIYRIAQEALTNIERHAQASKIELELQSEATSIRLVISDNGQGFSLDDAEKRERYGLRGMRERSALVDGKLKVESVPGDGTRVEFLVKEQQKIKDADMTWK